MAYNKKSNASWHETNERFINPYNFIPLPDSITRTEPKYGTLCGKIVCHMTAHTPVAVPDHEKRTADKIGHYSYPFFSVGDKPIIPGSSIRGVVRSMFEAVTNSCVSVNNNNILSARSSAPKLPGILVCKNGNFTLYKAEKRKYNKDIELKANQVLRTWYGIKGNLQTQIFEKTLTEVKCEELEKSVDDYKECVEIYKKNINDLENKCTYKINKDGMTPLFYQVVEINGKRIVYLSPSQIGRTVFHNKLNDLLGDHTSCKIREDEKLCEACALFGITSDKQMNYAGRVRFSDAQAEKFISLKEQTLKELASPQISSVEFYTKRPYENGDQSKPAKRWTYDYYINEKNKMIDTKVKLNGRKFYFHYKTDSYSTKEKTKRNSTMELADIGSKFIFDVYFDNISEDQLKKLLWVLALGENSEESERLYKIGHGKPLGLGSVKIIVDDVILRKYDNETKTYMVNAEKPDNYINNCTLKLNKSLAAITNIGTAESTLVSYPIAEDKTAKVGNSTAAHQWFIANRSMNGTGVNWDINYTLPAVTKKDISLPAYEKSSEPVSAAPKTQTFGENFSGGIMWKKSSHNSNSTKTNQSNRKKKR